MKHVLWITTYGENFNTTIKEYDLIGDITTDDNGQPNDLNLTFDEQKEASQLIKVEIVSFKWAKIQFFSLSVLGNAGHKTWLGKNC